MKRSKPTGTKSLRVLQPTELAQVNAGDGVAGIFKLKQHVDNPAQTP